MQDEQRVKKMDADIEYREKLMEMMEIEIY